MWRNLLCLLLVLAPVAAQATPPIVVSASPANVAVTIYRDPDRAYDPINKESPTAFAFIAETRVVDLPPGPVTIRFEGVAGAIVPQSAIMFGASPRERNRDAALLSQGGLVDAFTGQNVLVRRTNPATGGVTEERATIRSSADRLIISTAQGNEAMYCTGVAQTLIYPNAPATLSSKPVLTMTTKDQPGGRVTVTLAYIATGFDWDATYVATLSEDQKSVALQAWLTMVSADETSFVDARTGAVAGRINRSEETRDDTARDVTRAAENLSLKSQCWPNDTTTSGLPYQPFGSMPPPQPPPIMMDYEVVTVTASRMMMKAQSAPMAVTAVAEKLGDLVFYRIPVPVTVAARSQKQVAFLADKRVKGAMIYRSRTYLSGSQGYGFRDPELLFRFANSKRSGLGDPLPGGNVILYQDSGAGRQLIGETKIDNKTTDEDVELGFGDRQSVTLERDESGARRGHRYVIKNENPYPIRFDLEFYNQDNSQFFILPATVIAKPGKRVWSIDVPANGERLVSFEVRASPSR
jgi:hypothetical protein